MKLLHNPSTDPHYNMAFDEYCLQSLPLDEPLCYFWRNRPAVIVGVSQNVYAEVNLDYLTQHGIVLARRMTGGGAVYHDLQNLNYTIVGRSADFETDYAGYMQYVVDALRALGVPASANGRNDILVDGMKVSGYAKRVWHDRLMVHGTLLYDVDLPVLTQVLSVPGSKMQALGVASVRSRVANLKSYLPDDIRSIAVLQTAMERLLSHDFQDGEMYLSEKQEAEVQSLADAKFATWQWNYGRSPRLGTMHSRKLPCGTVEVHLTVDRGVVTALRFGGDFLGNRPVDGLADILLGCRYEAAALRERLTDAGVAQYFDGVDAAVLTDLLLNG
ncbi:MAG: lipoate--protein ligase [Bacteroidales bacterium]|nr:lipoate--protein ligase [Bacteroidales bacterium]MCR5714531.1 lipoate--protein ligase [Bacteroidales bacterium]